MSMLSYVIPCYRSEKTIRGVVAEIDDTLAKRPGDDYEIILVNDCSPDGTWQVLHALSEENSRVIAINLARNFGQHAALMAGLRQSRGDIVICLDDDGQTPADESPKLIEKIAEGYDLVYAAYDSKKQSGFRNFGSAVNSRMTEQMLGKPKDLVVNSYFAARRFIVEEMVRYQNCYPYVLGLALRSTRNICNVPVHHRARVEGKSGYTLGKLISLWLNGFTSFSIKPLRFAAYAGFASSVIGLIYGIYVLIHRLLVPEVPSGWSSTMIIILLLGGLILVVLGLIGEYLGRIYMCLNAQPQYIIRDVEKEGKPWKDRE